MNLNKNVRLKISLFIAVIGIATLVVGVSYALFNTVVESNKNQVIKAGAVALQFTETGEKLQLLNLQEQTDEEGMSSDNYYSFTIKNIGSDTAYYAVMLVDEESETNTLSPKYIRANIEVDGVINNPVNIGLAERIIYKDTLEKNVTKEYKLRIWLNFGDLTDEEKKAQLYKEAYFKIKVVAQQTDDITSDYVLTCDPMESDTSGANVPSLASNMIPVCYNSEYDLWLKADSTNASQSHQWYSYSGKTWANAVTVTETNRQTYLDADPGTVIPMDDMNTMLVWIPRFSATSNGSYNGGTQANPGAFNITFVNTETSAHDAFTFGEEISGFWMGKFENSSNEDCVPADNSAVGSGCNLNTIRPKILPNATSWRGAMVSTFFYDILNMTESGNQYGFDKTKDTTLDTHMLKNNEWGAVAYLTQSIYGRCTSSTSCTEVGINNNSSYITGYRAPAGSSSSVTNGAYNTTLGMDASTTGNIYGVYDMSGGSFEFVMGVYTDGSKLWSGRSTTSNEHSGFNGCLGSSCSSTLETGVAYPSDSKYYNLYTTSSSYTSEGLQHAMTETSGWYSDFADFVFSSSPWFDRGGYYNDSTSAGIFNFGHNLGFSNSNLSSRSSIIIN